MKRTKKFISIILTFTLLVTTLFFANVFTVSQATMYDMDKAKENTGSNTLSVNSSDYVTFSYPTDIYMNVGESLEDVGYKIGLTGHYGDSTDYRIIVASNAWGGCYEKNVANNMTMLQKFNNYTYSSTTNGNSATTKEGWNGDNCFWVKDTGTMNETIFLQGTANAEVGDFTFSTGSGGKDVVVMQHYELSKWKTKYSNNNSAMTMNVHIYNKAPLDDAIKNSLTSSNGSLNWNEYLSVKAEAERVLKTREVTQSQVNEATNNLVNFKFEYNYADYSAVNLAIERANALNPENYVSFDGVNNAIANVQWKLDKSNQSMVNNFALQINNAINALVPLAGDFVNYNKAVSSANALDSANYTLETWAVLQTALSVDVSSCDKTRQAEIDKQTDLILQAISALEMKHADYSQLDLAINQLPQYGQSFYQQGTWLKYYSALQNATAVSRDLKIISQKTVDDAQIRLTNAFNALKLKDADYTAVNTAIAKANSYVSDNYSNWSAVESAIANVVRGYDITKQNQVDIMANNINKALAALTYSGADYSEVFLAIEKANALNKDNYLDFSSVENAISAVDYTKNITQQADVNLYAFNINSAVNSLVLKDANYIILCIYYPRALQLNPNDYMDFSAVEKAMKAVNFELKIDQQELVDKMANDLVNAMESLVKAINLNLDITGDGTVSYNNTVVENIATVKVPENSVVDLKAMPALGAKFLYWVDSNGRICSYLPEISVVAVYSTKYTAVFTTENPSTYTVTFIGLNDTIISVQQVSEGENAPVPALPEYYGYTFVGWNGDFTAVLDNVVIRAGYEKVERSYSVTAPSNVTVKGVSKSDGTYSYNTKLMFTLDDYTNFAGWTLDGVNVVSYDKEYVVFVGMNINLTYLTNENGQVKPVPTVLVTNVSVNDSENEPTKSVVTILVESSFPYAEYELVNTGLIISKMDKELTIENANNDKDILMRTSQSMQYNLAIKVAKGNNVYYRGFAIFKNISTGEVVTLYTNANSVSV